MTDDLDGLLSRYEIALRGYTDADGIRRPVKAILLLPADLTRHEAARINAVLDGCVQPTPEAR